MMKHPRFGSALAVAALFGLFVVTGLRGVDFGDHWDEPEWHIQPVRDMVTSGVLLPHRYIYPSLTKWLGMLPTVPAALKAAASTRGDARAIHAAMRRAVDAPDYRLSMRRVFLVTSALAIIWTYLAARAFGRARWESVVAAAALALSWEFAYHARWITNDCILTQFAALTLVLLGTFARTRRPGWLYGAAVVVGLGTGAKFPGVVLLLPVLATSVAMRPARGLGVHAARLVVLSAVAFGSYLLTTPGTLVEPFKFIDDIRLISIVYQGTHYGYTVTGPLQHLRVAFSYLAFAFFSPYTPIAVALFVAAIVGAVAWLRRDRYAVAVLVGFPTAYLLFFCGKYTIAVVRNFILLSPFLAILAARGVAAVAARLGVVAARLGPVAARLGPRRAAILGLAPLLGAAAVLNAAWLVRAGESIRTADAKSEVRDAVAWIAGHGRTRVRVSDRVRTLAREQGLALPANVTNGPDAGAVVFFAQTDGPPDRRWTTNDPWLTRAVFGPREVNFNWYSTWAGPDRVVAMTNEKATAAGVAFAQWGAPAAAPPAARPPAAARLPAAPSPAAAHPPAAPSPAAAHPPAAPPAAAAHPPAARPPAAAPVTTKPRQQ
jgi:dolichyl-phosphate-mannose-protein mannosyltransferase